MATITIPANENGMIFDPEINDVVATAINVDPFGFEDVVIYSHGWSTDADNALDDYAIFSVGLSRRLLLEEAAVQGIFAKPPRPALEMGIHWPSDITEDPTSPLNALQLFTFYTMEHRADAVGKNLVYSLLRIVLEAREGLSGIRFLLLGHSFGCKVMCAALQAVQKDIQGGSIAVPAGTSWRVVLMEPATDWDNLEPTDVYGAISQMPNLRLLITKSQKDAALTTWYPAAARVANLFHGFNPTPALGASGPTAPTILAFGGADQIAIGPGFQTATIAATMHRLVVADLTPIHTVRATGPNPAYTGGGIAGSHADIKFDEMYRLVGGFLFSA